jgi:hypothetical protein
MLIVQRLILVKRPLIFFPEHESTLVFDVQKQAPVLKVECFAQLTVKLRSSYSWF